MSNELSEALRIINNEIDDYFKKLLISDNSKLAQAMKYSIIASGKRLRPFLTIISASIFDYPLEKTIPTAAAIELIHSYSLIHDDLPAMDNASLRRGKKTCHLEFDEACAILAGDSLLTLAFEILSNSTTHPDAEIRCKIIAELAKSSGYLGMAGGQSLDLIYEKSNPSFEELISMQDLKTGKLLSCAATIGLLLANAPESAIKSMQDYCKNIGIAFQIYDDYLDIVGNEGEVGKDLNKDLGAGKATIINLLGTEKALRFASDLISKAKDAIKDFGPKAKLLNDLADYIIDRKS